MSSTESPIVSIPRPTRLSYGSPARRTPTTSALGPWVTTSDADRVDSLGVGSAEANRSDLDADPQAAGPAASVANRRGP
jgi:hypothetical protein